MDVLSPEPVLELAGMDLSYAASLGALPELDVTASSIRSTATQPNDTNRTVTHDQSGNR